MNDEEQVMNDEERQLLTQLDGLLERSIAVLSGNEALSILAEMADIAARIRALRVTNAEEQRLLNEVAEMTNLLNISTDVIKVLDGRCTELVTEVADLRVQLRRAEMQRDTARAERDTARAEASRST